MPPRPNTPRISYPGTTGGEESAAAGADGVTLGRVSWAGVTVCGAMVGGTAEASGWGGRVAGTSRAGSCGRVSSTEAPRAVGPVKDGWGTQLPDNTTKIRVPVGKEV